LLCGQAKLFGPESFAYSHGWLGKFKTRQGMKQIVKHGEANDADSHGVELAWNAIPKIAKAGGYAAQDIDNQDEKGQFWRQVPQLWWQQTGRRVQHQSVAVLQCHWDKRELFVIGKSKRPRLTLADIRRGMQRQQLSGMRQRDMRDTFTSV
jgi:hypothetical protein